MNNQNSKKNEENAVSPVLWSAKVNAHQELRLEGTRDQRTGRLILQDTETGQLLLNESVRLSYSVVPGAGDLQEMRERADDQLGSPEQSQPPEVYRRSPFTGFQEPGAAPNSPFIYVTRPMSEAEWAGWFRNQSVRPMRHSLDAPIPEGATGEPGSTFLEGQPLPWYERGAYPTRREFLDLAVRIKGSNELGIAWTQRPMWEVGDVTPWELYDDGEGWQAVAVLLRERDR